jgi:hypothetical protein
VEESVVHATTRYQAASRTTPSRTAADQGSQRPMLTPGLGELAG